MSKAVSAKKARPKSPSVKNGPTPRRKQAPSFRPQRSGAPESIIGLNALRWIPELRTCAACPK
jgi:hypothetical protein